MAYKRNVIIQWSSKVYDIILFVNNFIIFVFIITRLHSNKFHQMAIAVYKGTQVKVMRVAIYTGSQMLSEHTYESSCYK